MDPRRELLKKCRYFILDMDGTFYLGDDIIPGSLEFMDTLKKTGREFLFFTNNSSKSPEVYIQKLAKMGCNITRDQIMTSGDVTIAYLNTYYKNKSVYLVGTPALEKSFRDQGINLFTDDIENYVPGNHPVDRKPDIVVIGFDTTLTYQKLERASSYIRAGSQFFATHLDINCPTANGFIIDVGSFCAAIQLSTGVAPRYFGKPYPETIEMILAHTKGRKDELAFVGDRLYTDVATGVQNGVPGLLVLSGEATSEDVEKSSVKPDAIFANLKEIADLLE